MNPFDMMKNLQGMQVKMQEAQARIAKIECEGSSGGALARVKMDGAFRMVSIFIDPSLKDPEDIAMIADLVLAASRDAHGKVSAAIQAEMQNATGGMQLPGMFGMGG